MSLVHRENVFARPVCGRTRRSLAGMLLGAAVVLGHGLLAPSPAQAMQVTPLRFEVATSGRDASGAIQVINTRDKPIPVETGVVERHIQPDGEQTFEPADEDFLIFPPSAVIQPGQAQTFRVQWLGAPDLATSKSFYVGVSEIPVELPDNASGVQIAFKFNVAMHVSPEGVEPAPAIASASIGESETGEPVVIAEIANNGTKYAYTDQMTFSVSAGGAETRIEPQDIKQLGAVQLIPPKGTVAVEIPVGPGDWSDPVAVDVELAD